MTASYEATHAEHLRKSRGCNQSEIQQESLYMSFLEGNLRPIVNNSAAAPLLQYIPLLSQYQYTAAATSALLCHSATKLLPPHHPCLVSDTDTNIIHSY